MLKTTLKCWLSGLVALDRGSKVCRHIAFHVKPNYLLSSSFDAIPNNKLASWNANLLICISRHQSRLLRHAHVTSTQANRVGHGTSNHVKAHLDWVVISAWSIHQRQHQQPTWTASTRLFAITIKTIDFYGHAADGGCCWPADIGERPRSFHQRKTEELYLLCANVCWLLLLLLPMQKGAVIYGERHNTNRQHHHYHVVGDGVWKSSVCQPCSGRGKLMVEKIVECFCLEDLCFCYGGEIAQRAIDGDRESTWYWVVMLLDFSRLTLPEIMATELGQNP